MRAHHHRPARPDPALRRAVGSEQLATTDLWYARLCNSAARSTGGALLGQLSPTDRRAVVAALIGPPDSTIVVPMCRSDVRPGVADGGARGRHSGLSTLGSEAVAAAEALGARVLASSRDDGPGIRHCCRRLAIRYSTTSR